MSGNLPIVLCATDERIRNAEPRHSISMPSAPACRPPATKSIGGAWSSWPRRRSFWSSCIASFRGRRPIGTSRSGGADFLKLMAASLSLAGATGCLLRQPEEKIVPYVRQPERIIPGDELFYATATTLGGYAQGVLVSSRMGRPIKVEGNPEHPASLGATDIFGQAVGLVAVRSRSFQDGGFSRQHRDLGSFSSRAGRRDAAGRQRPAARGWRF